MKQGRGRRYNHKIKRKQAEYKIWFNEQCQRNKEQSEAKKLLEKGFTTSSNFAYNKHIHEPQTQEWEKINSNFAQNHELQLKNKIKQQKRNSYLENKVKN